MYMTYAGWLTDIVYRISTEMDVKDKVHALGSDLIVTHYLWINRLVCDKLYFKFNFGV